MQRKYSEVVNYIPSFPNMELRNNNRELPTNPKLSPPEPYRPNHSPTVYANTQFQPFLTPNQVPPSSMTNTPTFDFVERRSLPTFHHTYTVSQQMHSPNVDNRQQNNNGFRGNSFLNQASNPRRPTQQNFSTQPIQQFSSPQNLMRHQQINLGQQFATRRNLMTAHTSPNKIQNGQSNNNPSGIFMNFAPPQNHSLTPSNPRENGRICQSLIIPQINMASRNYQSKSDLSSLLALQNASSQSSVDLESTFSSDNNASWVDLASPLLSEQGSRPRKLQSQQNNRKREEVWKSVDLQMLKNISYQSTAQLNRRINMGNVDQTNQKQQNFPKQKFVQLEYNNFELIDKKSSFDPCNKQKEQECKSNEIKFRKRNDHNSSANVVSISDIAKFHEIKQVPRRQITIEDFEVIQKIGKGAYGDVFLARDKKSKFLCVLKSLSKKKIKELKMEELVFREIKIQMYLLHKHITSLYGVFDDQNKIYLIMQCMPDGSMSSNGKKKISQNETAHLLQQVCEGLQYMHREDIIHRDIKPQNLLLNNTYLKIGDFGCAVFGNTLRRTVVGCYAYISPQQFSNNPYDQKIDSWSVGILAYQMLTGKPPYEQKLRKVAQSQIFDEKNLNETHQSPTVQFSELNFPKDLKLSVDAIDFIKRLLDPDPATRADIKQALRHKFLQKAKQYERYLQSQL